MPAFVDGVLEDCNSCEKIKILGFSQGTTITLGFLAKFPQYHSKIDKVVMLAATGRPKTLPAINYISKQDCNLIKSIFGHRALLEEVITLLYAILPSSLYSQMLKSSMSRLFKWNFQCLSKQHHIYSHLYCSTSVSLVLHWFHIINSGEFVQNRSKIVYELNNVPGNKLSLFFGEQDSLEDKEYLLGQIEGIQEYHRVIPDYEHLDFLWSPQNPEKLYPHVLDAFSSDVQK